MENKENLIAKEQTTKENRIWVRIASACNNKCVFCLDENAQDGTLVPEDEVKKNIKNGYKEGCYNRVIISGGEASINPKFPEYIRYAKEVGYDRVQTVTNGNMFAIESFCKKVFAAGLDEVTFSFHGHTPKLHDYLVDIPGAFKKSLKGIVYVKKYFPKVIVNIDVVVNKVNISFLPDIVKFFMKLGVYEYDLLHIIPFGRGFDKYKDILFYDVKDYLKPLHETWELSKIPGMYMWTNRFPVEAFEGYEDLIQDPRKIKSEVMGEGYKMYSDFITSKGEKKPHCYGAACKHCFLQQYCHDFLGHTKVEVPKEEKVIINDARLDELKKHDKAYIVLRSEWFPSEIYKKFGESAYEFKSYIGDIPITSNQELVNIPRCIREHGNKGRYEYYPDIRQGEGSLEEYTENYTLNFYRKKSPRCKSCIYNSECQGININFIRSYGFDLLQPIRTKNSYKEYEEKFIKIVPERYLESYRDIIDINPYVRFIEYIGDFDSAKNHTYLELGSGIGVGLKYFKDQGYNIVGVDKATYNVFDETDVEMPIYNFDFSQGLSGAPLKEKYDIILLVNIVHEYFAYIDDFEEHYYKIFQNIYEKLELGGKVLFNISDYTHTFSDSFLKKLLSVGYVFELADKKSAGEKNIFYVLKKI